ncbi:MAG: CBS domain-containing protein [Pirellulales bacterium]
MLVCPICGAENIEGDDACSECTQTLTEMSVRVPATSLEADLVRDRIELLPTKPPVTVSPQSRVGDVLATMADSRIGCVLVVEQGKMVGIFTERDALMRLNTDAAKLSDKPISDYMTKNPEILPAKSKIAFALHKMDLGGYRHLPVLDGEKPVGVISIRDILGYLTSRIATG